VNQSRSSCTKASTTTMFVTVRDYGWAQPRLHHCVHGIPWLLVCHRTLWISPDYCWTARHHGLHGWPCPCTTRCMETCKLVIAHFETL
jgi:hypothetical protein